MTFHNIFKGGSKKNGRLCIKLGAMFFLKAGNQNNRADKLNNITKTDGAPDAILSAIKFILPVDIINIQKTVDTKA